MSTRNLGASVRAKLLARAREDRHNFDLVLRRYAIERILYRISISAHAEQFLLKGALLFGEGQTRGRVWHCSISGVIG